MSFMDHLESLRWHLVRAIIGVLVGMIGLLVVMDEFLQYVVLGPMQVDFPTNRLLCDLDPDMCVRNLEVSLQAISPTEQFTRTILVAIIGGLIISFPYFAWEMWRFIKPGLKYNEYKNTRGAVAIVSVLFLIGVAFAYFIMAPFALSFFANYQISSGVAIENNWRIGKVIGLIVQLCLAGGILFELPVMAFVLSRIGIVTPQLMKKYRKHAVVGIMITAGILTPSPDIFNQLLLALPMFLLYELSIGISSRVWKKKQQRDAAFMGNEPGPEQAASGESQQQPGDKASDSSDDENNSHE